MNKKQSKRQRDIKTKLMAAICMLLVSSIMMVSTTYAWFTLSTAPEVTGINTAVGANGNLEMALQPSEGDSENITSGTADSMATAVPKVSNITWGNLVKLDGTGDQSYGLEKITLYPSALNVESDVIGINPLSTPVYGADGRVADLSENTVLGTYRNDSFYTKNEEGSTAIYGVRAVGTSSGITPRELAFNQAMSNANSAASSARGVASAALNANGSLLADIALTHALAADGATETYTDVQVAALGRILDALLGTDATKVDGALEYIEYALKQYIIADAITPAAMETTYTETVTAVEDADLAALAAGTETITGVTLSDNMKGWINTLTTMKNAVNTAKTEYAKIGTDYTWEKIEPVVSPLVNADELSVNGYSVGELMANPGAAAGKILADGGVKLYMNSGAGIFADIADFAGNYQAGITIAKLEYGELLKMENVPATMSTNGVSTTYLTSAADEVDDFVPVGGGDGETPLTDFYGYVIDLAFRTNAADSWLQLQQTGVDRIYEDGSNTNTQGQGAVMKFRTSSSSFQAQSVKELMKAIGIVFFDTDSREIISYAMLDDSKATTDEQGYTSMPLVLATKTDAGLVMKENTPAAEGQTDTLDESIAIMELKQNEVHELSVLVYLDGNKVQNDDVAADVAKSLEGSMNLQFSSSANLVAMDYSELKSGTGGALNGGSGTNTPATPTVINLTPSVEAGETGVTVSNAKYADGKIGFTLTGWTDQTVTIKVGEAEAVEVTPTTVEGVTVASYTAANVTADTAIVITITA